MSVLVVRIQVWCRVYSVGFRVDFWGPRFRFGIGLMAKGVEFGIWDSRFGVEE